MNLGAIQITKTRKHAADGPGDHPQSGVTFTVNGVTTTATDANGVTCVSGLPFGAYTVHENVPAGYSGEADKSVTVDQRDLTTDCSGNPETVSFHNTSLTNLNVTIGSQIDGGTSTHVAYTNTAIDGDTGANGDGTFVADDLQPGTYVCTVVIDP